MNQEHMEIKTPEFVSIQFRLAGLGSRAAAFIIDQLILSTFNILLFVIVFFVMRGMSSLPILGESSVPIAITIIVLFIINWGYFFVLEFFWGGKTIGKRVIGIRVVQENGHSITLLSSFIRNFMRIIDSLPTGYFLGMMMVFFHSKHKRLGDMVAGTIVVHERKAKRKKKLSPVEKEIQTRGLSKDDLMVSDWALKSLGQKEWKLISTYVDRFHQLSLAERSNLTKQIAAILLPKIGEDAAGKSESEIENTLLVLYLILRDEWGWE